MKYKARTFDTIFYLENFLNANNIPPQNIITVLRQNSPNGLGRVQVLYLVESEENNGSN